MPFGTCSQETSTHQPTFVDDLPVRAVSSPRDLPPVHYHDAPGSPDVDNPPSPEGKYNEH